jgi:GTP-binding protein
MQFVDEAVIEVQAGKGGDGALSFRRGRNLPKGGPDGGNGGNGGSIELVGDAALNTLVDFRYSPLYRAANGGAGAGQQKTGANGPALRVSVPLGTTIIDEETRAPIGDVARQSEVVLVARGGQRGLGNAHFKSSTNRAPRQTTPGKPGEHRRLRLALKVIADVGLLGMPNAGKSTLIARVSASRPKVADYPFTTLIPNLGVVRVDADASFVMADVPGLIAGASRGAGLGYRFLRHLSRTRLLLHLVDLVPVDGSDPVANCRATLAELFLYSDAFRERDIWLVGTKMDLPGADAALSALRSAYPDRPCFGISAVTGMGVDRVVGAAMEHVAGYRRRLLDDAEFAAAEHSFAQRIGADVLDRTFEDARARLRRRAPETVEVEYRRE